MALYNTLSYFETDTSFSILSCYYIITNKGKSTLFKLIYTIEHAWYMIAA